MAADQILAQAEQGILQYLKAKKANNELAENYYQDALSHVLPNLRAWYCLGNPW